MTTSSFLLSFSVAWILLLLVAGCAGKRNWDYEPISIDVRTTDASKINIEATVESMGRDGYAFTGKVLLNFDMDETTMVEATAYRSSTGSEEDYKLLPWSIPKQTFEKFANSHYKEIVYKNLEHCSNIPKPENVYPWPKGNYSFDRCTATGDGMPEIVPEGYYKVIFTISGEVEAGFTTIVKLVTKPDMIG
ncbi:uncharacterized protein [Drosophila virilis]|uniref:Uncharacterized protein n=1 Tax=Drosophila virilis TaxID=7244 RepID=B4LNL5_DROVI|nr:uncharacterized protein LOC6625349 [Drosophila virilis]EDW62195.1 uncharacterized protein Dvir_GJ19880 [Drosophila virilis]